MSQILEQPWLYLMMEGKKHKQTAKPILLVELTLITAAS